jgi:dTDP-4-amino-4,6-dideoxygalactose transaminase
MTYIPFLDLKRASSELSTSLEAATLRVVNSGWYILGPETEAFEEEFARLVGTRYCISVGNGLDALTIALKALGIGIGDEVVVPTNTFIATWLAVTLVGATVVGVEPDPLTHVITANALDAHCSSRTKAIIPVHLYGRPCPMVEIVAWAQKRGISVVEDAAQAHGARWATRSVGSFGTCGCWSFYPSKNLGALGDAGAITTNDPVINDLARRLRNYGSQDKYYYENIGLNSRMSEMNAAVLRVKLRVLEDWNRRRQEIALHYARRLNGLPLELPNLDMLEESSWHLFVIRTQQRNELQSFLRRYGIETQIHYPIPPHRQKPYRQQFHPDYFPVANLLADQVLSLPMGPHISLSEVDYICDVMHQFYIQSEAYYVYPRI